MVASTKHTPSYLAAMTVLLLTVSNVALPARAVAEAVRLEVTPNPAPILCAVEPRDIGFFEALATPSNRLAPRDPKVVVDLFQDASMAPPRGTLQEILVTAEELRVCTNSYDFARAYALYTDDYWRRKIRGEMDIIVIRTEYFAPNEQDLQYLPWMLIDARQLADRRVGAIFGITNPLDGIDEEILFVFSREHERWLIDDIVVSIGAYEATETATPSP